MDAQVIQVLITTYPLVIHNFVDKNASLSEVYSR